MAIHGHPQLRTAPRRTAAAALTAALAAATLASTAASAQAAVAADTGSPARQTVATSGNSTLSWAITASGSRVAVRPTNYPTPMSPEAITHPNADYAGSTIRAHEPAAASRGAASPVGFAAVPQLPGIDVSSFQGSVNWGSVAPHIDFVYIKATEGTYYTNPDFAQQYNGSYNAGLIRGSYHFAIPNNSGGAAQADYFIAHGGGWSGDGRTLPGALDIEYNPYGAECYGLTHASMVSWIHNFVNEYAAREHVYPTIYTTTDWWITCTGNNSGFGGLDPLWIANFSASGGGPLPAGWGVYTFWQYADSGSLPGDQDVFNGALSRLQALATNG
jgi:GH25 family lysozyme M1 (1,4-beta-N-acetylmuramidase)